MTVGKAAVLTAAFIGAVALGVAIGPSITDRMSDRDTAISKAPAVSEQARPAAEKPAADRSARTARKSTKADAPVAIAANAVRADEPRVHQRLKPILNRGTKMEMAAQGFLTAEEFATVAHAAKNTNVPFVVLKDRVLSQKRPLADSMTDAIREFKPDLDAKAEVAKAQNEARADIADIAN
ncbi:MAG TPA: hypothetical protein VH740_21880 [Vicinamibacterales bacterium]